MIIRTRNWLFGTTSFTPASLCSIEGEGEGDGGGGGSVLGNAKPEGDAPVKDGDKPEGDKPAGDKPEGDKPDDKKDETPEEKATREAAEKADKEKKVGETLKSYEALKMPDGLARDHAITTEFLKDAAERGVPAEAAQAMIDRMGPKMVEAIQAPYNAWADTQKKWVADIQTDAEYGGKDIAANLGVAAASIDKVLGQNTAEAKSFREMLAFTGAGNNPDMVRFMYRIGKMLKEGGPIGGRNAVGKDVPLAQKMYGGGA